MNKRILLIGTLVYIFVVAVTGFMLFAKQSPISWSMEKVEERQPACFRLSGEEVCNVIRGLDNSNTRPLKGFERLRLKEVYYDDGGYRFTNAYARWVNDNQRNSLFIFALLSATFFGTILYISRKKHV